MKALTIQTSRKITEKELEQVTGGTFWPNEYSASNYNQFGISTDYYFFSKHQFMYNGRFISYEQANEIVRIGFSVLNSLNSEYDHKDNIGINENSFKRAFNYQLKLKFGDDWMWTGNKGINYGWLPIGGWHILVMEVLIWRMHFF